jgi:hypothetical protein
MGCNSRPLAKRFQPAQPPPAHFHNLQPGQILCRIQTGAPVALQRHCGAPAQIRAADRSSGTPAVLPGRYVASVDHTGLLRRPARCSVITQTARAHAATAVLSDCLRFCMCGLVLYCSSAGQPRRKNALPHPGRDPRGCRRRAKRPSSSTRQANKVGRMSRRASRI